jgi:hypothetical protein
MDQQYRQAYLDLYRDFGSFPFLLPRPYPPFHQEVIEIIDRVSADLTSRKQVRVDAKYFLALNFTFMIVAPLEVAPPPREPGLLYSYIEQDARTIIEDAANRTTGEEITGGHIVESLGQRYRDLRIAAFNLWG